MAPEFSDDSVSASDDDSEPLETEQSDDDLDEDAQHLDGRSGGAKQDVQSSKGAAAGSSGLQQAGGASTAAAAGTAAAAAADRAAEAALMAGELTRDAALMQLQVNDLLAEVRPAPLKAAALATVLQQLRDVLGAIPEQEVTGSLLSGFISGLGLEPQEVGLHFHPPAAVEAVGSVPLGTCPRPSPQVLDVAVVMPEACLHRKDHLNYRYHARRALYLAVVSQALAAAPTFGVTAVEAVGGDPTRPALLVSVSKGAVVRLLPVPPRGMFPLHKLAPDRNNVRWVTRPGAEQQQKQQANGAAEAPAARRPEAVSGQPSDWLATPHYNAAVAADQAALDQSANLAARLKGGAAMRDALLLLKTWGMQAGIGAAGSHSSSSSGGSAADLAVPTPPGGGFSGHLLAAVLVRAYEAAGVAATAMTAFQLFRATLGMMADAAAWSRGLSLARAEPAQQQQQNQQQGPPPVAAFRKAYPVVLLDVSGWLNLAAGVPLSLLQQAQLTARRTLAALDHPADPEGAFAAAFLTRTRPAAAFDYVWGVDLPAPDGGTPRPGDVSALRQEEATVEGLVRKALTTRATLVRALPRVPAFPPVGRAGGAVAALAGGLGSASPSTVLVAAVVDAQEALRAVDVGPAADDAAAAARFRALWGDKAELRRFADGKICEAVVWDAPPDERHTVPDAAVTHLLRRHLPAGTLVSCSSSRLDGALPGPPPGGLGVVAVGRAVEAALDKLGKHLRALGEVVLKVVGVQPVSAVSRRTAPFVPQPHPLVGGPGGLGAATAAGGNLPRCIEPLEVMVTLEGSGKWPDDPTAYAKMKAALGCQLAAALETSAGFRVSPCEEAVDVFVDGFAFRLLLHTDRDAAMHAKAAAAGPHAHHHHVVAHAPPLVLRLSWHHGLVSAIEGQHAAFGPTCRLAKRWVGCQLAGSCLPPEAVELLVGAAFCGPSTAPTPASRVAGLLRFLSLLSSHPWGRAPLLVDPLREVGEAARRSLLAEYEARRDAGAAPAMFLATPRDLHSSLWTLERPSAAVLQHLAAAAAAAAARLAALQERSDGAGDDWGRLFESPVADFDAWVMLRRDALPNADRALPGAARRLARHLERAGATARKRSRSGGPDAAAPAAKSARAVLRAFPARVVSSQPTEALVPELLVGFDPVSRYVALLEERFGHIAVFCADAVGGYPAVGVKWLPAAFVPTPLRPALAHCVVEAGGGRVLPHLPQVLQEMHLMGEGLVAEVVAL